MSRATFVSECGCYIAHPYGASGTAYDVIEVKTGTVWLHGRYVPTGWGDTDRRYTHAEFSRLVSGWRNQGEQRGKRWIEAFDLTFADVDTAVTIKPFTGNVVRRSYEAAFRRRIPSNHTRRIAEAAAVVARALAAEEASRCACNDHDIPTPCRCEPVKKASAT